MDDLKRPNLRNDTSAAEEESIREIGVFLDKDTRSGECFDFLIRVLESSLDPLNRLMAMEILLREARRRNSTLAMPTSVTSKLTGQEHQLFYDFLGRMNKIQGRSSIYKYPHHQYEYTDLVSFAHAYLKPQCEKFINKDSSIVAIGSCFAGNVTNYLKKRGIKAFNVEIGELVNNSYNNLWLLQNLSKVGTEENISWGEGLPQDFTDSCNKLLTHITTADCVIFTVGLSLALADTQGNVRAKPLFSYSRAIYAEYSLREIDVEQNTNNLVAIYDIIKLLNPRAKVIFTLSPVPLDGILDDSSSVVEMDCISKSIGRVSLNALKKLRPDYVYFPSFELVRWVACNQRIPLYGGDPSDQEARHVTSSIIAEIMRVFHNFYVADEEPSGSAS